MPNAIPLHDVAVIIAPEGTYITSNKRRDRITPASILVAIEDPNGGEILVPIDDLIDAWKTNTHRWDEETT